MEHIKTYDSLDEAFNYKPIFPEYDLQYNDYRAGVRSYVRKQDNDGIWQIIPVMMDWDFSKRTGDEVKDNIQQANELMQITARFVEQCYRVLLLWIFPKKGKELIGTNGRPVGGEVDDDQRTEIERLKDGLPSN